MSVLQSYWRCAEIILIAYQKRRAKLFAAGEIGGKWNQEWSWRMAMRSVGGGGFFWVGKQHDKYLVSLGATYIITWMHNCKLKLATWEKIHMKIWRRLDLEEWGIVSLKMWYSSCEQKDEEEDKVEISDAEGNNSRQKQNICPRSCSGRTLASLWN